MIKDLATMVWGKPWDEHNYDSGFDFHGPSPTEEQLRKLMAYLASKGICNILPYALAAAGFGLAGVAGGEHRT